MRKIFFTILLLLHCYAVFPQPMVLEWQACFGTPLLETARDVCSTGDGYIVLAETFSYATSTYDIMLVRTDLMGNKVWEKFLGGAYSEKPYRILPAGNDSYYISATSASLDGDISNNPYPNGLANTWLLKINGDGEILWDKMYGGTCYEEGWDACLTHDGGMVTLNYTCSGDGDVSNYFGMWDTWLLKTDTKGNKVWDFTIGTEFLDFPGAIIETSDLGFLVSSGSMPTTGGNITCEPFNDIASDIVLFKLDSLANIEWQRCYGGSEHESVHDILEIEDGYILACSVDSDDGDMTGAGYHYGHDAQGHPYSDIWLAKIDFEGNIRWHKCYGGTAFDSPNKIFKTGDGGFIVFAETESNNGDVSGNNSHVGVSDIWVFKISATGDLLWQQCFGGLGYERLDWSGVIDNGDGSYVITSTLSNNGNSGDLTCLPTPGGENIWLIQLRDTLFVNTENLPLQNTSVKVYPNPANEYVVFELKKPLPWGIITISDITGRQVAVIHATGDKTVWVTDGARPGVYLYQWAMDGYSLNGKILLK